MHFEFIRHQRLHPHIFNDQAARMILFKSNFSLDHLVFHTALTFHVAVLSDPNFINLLTPLTVHSYRILNDQLQVCICATGHDRRP